MRTILLVTAFASTACIHPNDPDDAASAQRRAQKERYDSLWERYETIERKRLARPQTPAAPGECDAIALWERGTDESFRNNHGEALRWFEASLACEPNTLVSSQAFHSACQAKDSARARVHFQQVD